MRVPGPLDATAASASSRSAAERTKIVDAYCFFALNAVASWEAKKCRTSSAYDVRLGSHTTSTASTWPVLKDYSTLLYSDCTTATLPACMVTHDRASAGPLRTA